MIILPAIDMIQGKPVRLYQGDYEQKEVVGESVIDTARRFAQAGAQYIHMVDLDGAKSGQRENARWIVQVSKEVDVPIEVGGGIRTMEDIEFYLSQGVNRVILGTAALQNEALLKEALHKYGSAISVGLDCRDGYAMAQGWLQASRYHYLEFSKYLEQLGVSNIILTDISKDGTMSGPNLEMLKSLQDAVSLDITASGGIHNLQDIRDLASLKLYGAITGKAVYAGAIDLKEAIRIGKEEAC